MNTEELLTSFRSDVRLPDHAAAQLIYAHATSSRRRVPRRRLVLAILAVAVAGGVASGAAALGGGSSPGTGTRSGDIARIDVTVDFTRSNGTLTSVTFTPKPEFAATSIEFQVEHSDASTYAEAYAELYSGATQVVFQEREPAPTTGSWSISPSDWNGGCGSGLYTVRWVAVGTETMSSQTDWFRCN